MFWGLTPALNLLEEYTLSKRDTPEELNILIIGGSDCRHILLTEAKKFLYAKCKINFYLIDACMEHVARQLLLLNIALQPPENLGLEQKTKIFMEIYGNTLVRPSTAKYLKSLASNLVKMVTDYDYLKSFMSFINIDIKYKERDYLENLLKFWCGRDDYNICECWDRRLRKSLGIRYDSKIGAFDWDLHMRFHSIGGKQVCTQEYKNFRLNGVAFSWLESEVSKPNRSLVCAVLPKGEKYTHYGYLGDVQTGPYVAFGLDCEDKSFLDSSNGQNSYRATDITERNLKQIFYEILDKQEYKHNKTSDLKLGSIIMKEEKLVVDVKSPDFVPKPPKKCVELEDQITFLTISALDMMKYKEKYRNLFDIVYFGNTSIKYLDKVLMEHIMKNDSVLIIENQLFVLSNRDRDLEEFGKNISEKIEGLNVTKHQFDILKDSYAKFILNK
ncbi:dynein assembly factor 3, axonemal homolog [Anoplophora glabripennis]|uniref:dynein assembly factor 3, axonemal homolog n=1 Tax=Anoplophora glabripennis TaxID=217634 RepID=UPI0008745B1E|nr:dynein assembly factor 3, axonemal homolog [Anoplophora glabripennis]